ncbi:MAG: TonB-dependent receptor, partial [Gammaproteobacteria bacterium]
MHRIKTLSTLTAGGWTLACFVLSAVPNFARAEGAGFDEEVTVVATTPAGGTGVPLDKLPFNVQSADSDALARSQSLDLTDFLSTNLASVNINSAQSNPLQPDVQYRGYTASPLLGLPMGIAVFQNGVRINEPLGDAVNWDLLPESAINTMSLIGGANPLFGLNTLGGALSVEMKTGFNFDGHAAEFSAGSWDRRNFTVESGGNNGAFGYYLNASYFEEDGWRDLSASDALNLYGAIGWRGAATSIDFSAAYGGSELRGNGASPVGLLAIDRQAVFTAPDITENDMHMFTLEAVHDFNDQVEFAGNAFHRKNATDSFNGDGSEFVECDLDGGMFLIEGLEEDDLAGLGFDDDDVCADNALGGGALIGPAPGVVVTDPDSLEAALNALAGGDGFQIDDLTDEISGSGLLSDEAINNTSERKQKTYGTDMQLAFTRDMFGRGNYFVGGFAYFKGEADFLSVTELSRLDPVTRSTAGLGTGSFVDGEATNVTTKTATWSVYFLNALDLTEAVTLTLGGRFNSTDVTLSDRSGARPELNGDHEFNRFNPSAGVTYSVTQALNLFAGYSESARAPTPIELACNEGVFEIARDAAIARGDDPDDVDFECRLPNAFLADPPLDQVVAKSYEAGLRGEFAGIRHRLGYFHTTNHDDIIFQTTGRATGLFANVDETRRQGIELALAASWQALDWSLSYSYLEAEFGSDFLALSPAHRFANDDGEIQVREGDRIPGIPAHQFKLGGDYNFSSGLRLGFDLLVNSDQVLRGDESNQLDEIDGYALVNLRASYRLDERVNLFVRVTNLFDTDYENFGLLGEDPSEVVSGLADTRPRFLGAGA